MFFHYLHLLKLKLLAPGCFALRVFLTSVSSAKTLNLKNIFLSFPLNANILEKSFLTYKYCRTNQLVQRRNSKRLQKLMRFWVTRRREISMISMEKRVLMDEEEWVEVVEEEEEPHSITISEILKKYSKTSLEQITPLRAFTTYLEWVAVRWLKIFYFTLFLTILF